MAEQFANLCQTTVGSSGYTSGSGVLNVLSTSTGTGASAFPSSAPFRVSICDQVTGSVKAILQVTAINSSTQWAVTAENDGNANAGDFVLGTMVTAGSLAASFPKRATMWHDDSISLVGSGITFNVQTGYQYNTNAFQSSSANADAFTNGCHLAGGTYTFSVYGSIDTSRGKVDWYLDNTLIVSGQDWYSGSFNGAVVKTATSITVVGNGWHTLKGITNGKNGSSSGFVIALVKMSFHQVSD